MSEHIQPAPGPHGAPLPPAHEDGEPRTPGVAYERTEFNLPLVLKVGAGLVVTAVVIHLAIWGVFVAFERRDRKPGGSLSELAPEDANRSIGRRLEDVKTPHLEGVERDAPLLILRTGEDRQEKFFVSSHVHVRIAGKDEASLFDLREGQRVTVTYRLPGGAAGGLGVATAIVSPPDEKAAKKTEPVQSDQPHSVTGEVEKVQPRDIAKARQWAETQQNRYGWTDRARGVAHVPVEEAMTEVLESKEFRHDGRKKGDGRPVYPSRSSSGHSAVGGAP